MKKQAFSLIELIFIIILIGVLSGVGFYLAQPDPTKKDAQYTLLKLKEARYHALGYDGLRSDHCMILTKEALTNAADNNDSMHHEIKSNTLITPYTTICFDVLGRPHDGMDINLSSLIRTNSDIVFKDGDKNTTIRLFNGTGYAIILCNN